MWIAAALAMLACGGGAPSAPPTISNRADGATQKSEACGRPAAKPGASRPGPMTLHAFLRDASGLPIGSAVNLGGLPIGEISQLSLVPADKGGAGARVEMRIRGDLDVFSNARPDERQRGASRGLLPRARSGTVLELSHPSAR